MQLACVILSSVVCSALPHFSTLFLNAMIFVGKKVLNLKGMFRFSHSKKNWPRYDHKCILVFM